MSSSAAGVEARGFGRVLDKLRLPWTLTRSLLVLGAAAVATTIGVRHAWEFTIDDAGISFAYAEHIGRGLGPVAVVGGPFVEGYSNPLWVLFLVPITWVVDSESLMLAAKVLGVACFGLGSLWAMRLLGLLEGRKWYELGWGEAVVPVALALTVQWVAWVPAGLENPLLMAGLMALALLDAHESKDPRRAPWSAVAAFAVAITRPEGAMYGAAYGGLKLVDALFRAEHRRQTLRYALWFAGLFAAYHVVHYAIFRDPLPNTFYAKPTRSDAFDKAVSYLKEHGKKSSFQYVLPLAAVGLVRHVRVKAGLLLMAAGASFFLLYSGGDWMPYGRFVSFALPPLAVLAAAGVENVARLVTWPLRRWVTPQPAALLCIVPLAVLWHEEHARDLRRLEKRGWCHLCSRVVDTKGVKRLAKTLNVESATLLTHDFGGPAWESTRSLYPIDLLGLCDFTLAKIPVYRAEQRGRHADRVLMRYAMHEQGSFPTFIYFPKNFFHGFGDSPEYHDGYFHLSRRPLGKEQRRDALFGIHRGVFVDYFPPIDEFDFRRIDGSLILLGWSITDVDASSGALTVTVMLLRGDKTPPSATRLRASLEGRDAKAKILSNRPRLFPRSVQSGSEWEPGEPRRIDLRLVVPPGTKGRRDLKLVVKAPRARARTVKLGTVTLPARPTPPTSVTWLRFPDDLPPARDPRLRESAESVRRLTYERFFVDDQTHDAPDLGERLVEIGQSLDAAGDTEQTYLAYVWASQVDRKLQRDLHERLEELRQPRSNDRFVRELALLRRAYSLGEDLWLLRLAAHYADAGKFDKAAYFLDRVPHPKQWAAAATVLRRNVDQRRVDQRPTVLYPQGLDGISTRFEEEKARGWTLDRAFGKTTYEVGAEDRPAFRGYEGERVLAARKRRQRGTATATSKPFVLEHRTLSLSFATYLGGTVELVANGKPVRSARRRRTSDLDVVFWDVADLIGQEVRIRVRFRAARSNDFVALDDIAVWE